MNSRIIRSSFTRFKRCHAVILSKQGKILSFQDPNFAGRWNKPSCDFKFYSNVAIQSNAEISPNPESSLENNKENLLKLQDMLDSFRTAGQSKHRVPVQGVEEFLRLAQNQKLTNADLCLLLNCCSSYLDYVPKTQREKILEFTWSLRGDSIDTPVKIDYLRACRSLNIPVDTSEILKESFNDTRLLEEVFAYLAETGDIEKINKLSAILKSKDIQFTEPMLAAAIRGNSIARRPENIKTVLETMDALRIDPTAITNVELVDDLIRRKEFEEAEKILKEKGESFNCNQLLRVLETSLKNGSSKEFIEKILKLFPSEMLNDSDIDYSFLNVCSKLIQEKKFEELRTFISSLPVPKFQANEDTDSYGQNLLKELITLPAPIEEILKLSNLLIDEGRNDRALQTAVGYAQKQNSPLFIDLLKHLKEKEPLRPHYFWPVLVQTAMVRGESGIIAALHKMKELNVEVDSETLTHYVLPQLVMTLKNVEKGVKQLAQAGVETSNLMVPLLSQLLYQQKIKEAIYINETYKAKYDGSVLIPPLITAFSLNKKRDRYFSQVTAKLVRSIKDKSQDPKYDVAGHFLVELISNPKTKFAQENIKTLLNELSAQTVKISKIAMEMTLQHLSKLINEAEKEDYMKTVVDRKLTLPAVEFSEGRMKAPKDMNLEELEQHLIELEAKNMNTRPILRRLLQMLVREGRYERALEVKKQCDKLNVDISPGMLACIFDMYTHLKDIPKAQQSLQNLYKKFPAFLLEEFKIIDFAALLVENGDIEGAKKIIRYRAGITEVKGGDHISKNVWNLLNNVAVISPNLDPNVKNHTYDFFTFLNKLGYCGHTNTALGPVIKEFLNRNKLVEAVEQYKEFCKTYRETPLQRQLITVLVRVMNQPEEQQKYNVTLDKTQEMLRDVLQVTTSIYGPVNTNLALIIALAEVGTDKQLRKLLIDPKVRINKETLKKNIEYLSSEKRLDALIKLARCSRGLGHIKEQEIYDMLMANLAQENNVEAALRLFEQLSTDDELKMSSEFTKMLVDLLKKNNLEIPTSVALYAK